MTWLLACRNRTRNIGLSQTANRRLPPQWKKRGRAISCCLREKATKPIRCCATDPLISTTAKKREQSCIAKGIRKRATDEGGTAKPVRSIGDVDAVDSNSSR